VRQLGEAGRLEWARSSENRAGAREMGKTFGLKNMDAIRTKESCSKGQATGGQRSRCQRWHNNRGYYSLNCEICLDDLSKLWGFEVRDPECENRISKFANESSEITRNSFQGENYVAH
jgi:hypothetical protein